MNMDYFDRQRQQKAEPCVMNVCRKAVQNTNYRTEIWTGCYAPPYHPVGTVHRTKEEAEKEHY